MTTKSNKNTEECFKYINERFEKGIFLPTSEDIERIKTYFEEAWGHNPQTNEENPQVAKNAAIHKLHGMAEAGFIHSDISFCMMDIVGFGEIISSTKDLFGLYNDTVTPVLSGVSTEIENAAKFLAIGLREHRNPKITDMSDVPKLEILLFADTIVVYPTFSLEVNKVFYEPFIQVWLVAMAARNIIMGCLSKKLLIRGSIGFGECLINQKPISYLGPTIMEVHSIEALQNWGGVAFAPSAAETMGVWKKLPREICRYDVPWKSGARADEVLNNYRYQPGFENYVVDWSFYGHAACNEDFGPWLNSQADKAEKRGKNDVRDIYLNTLSFLKSKLSEIEPLKP